MRRRKRIIKKNELSDITSKYDWEKKFKRKKPRMRWLLYSTIVSLVMIAGALGFIIPIASKLALLDVFLTLAPASNFINETNILILGVDEANRVHRSDTIMVANIDPTDREVKIISIPRDTLVIIPGRGLDKVNHAFAYGGIELSRGTVSKFLEVPIRYYVEIDIGGFASLIDKLGGITIDVEKRMYYVDYAGGLFVDLNPGVQKLNGREAVGYVRFRHDGDGDIGRIKRQQKFLNAVANELTRKGNILKSPGLILSMLSEIQTNMNFKQVLGMAMAVRGAYDLGRIEMASLPGKDVMIDDVYYWRPEWGATKSLVESFLKSERIKRVKTGSVVSTNAIF
jgi:LCP family protein required for cell wall assembly